MGSGFPERIHLSVAEARALAEGAMRGIGYESEEARILADHVIDAALCGYEYSGLPKLLNVADHPRFKAPRSPLRVLRETSVSVLFDGGNQSGMLGMYHATRALIERAQTHGFALVGVNNIWMSGRSAYYVEMVARAGLIGLHTVAAQPMVAPLGGARPALGTNPIAFGFPLDGDPLVIDLGTSAFMGTDLQFRERLGIPLPEGAAIDEHGHPTTDAAAARRGAILPFGGHKGYALALAMHALGVLASVTTDPVSTGYLFIAFKPDLFVPLDDYRRALAAEIALIKATPRQDGVDEIRIPGERAYRARAPPARGPRDRSTHPRRAERARQGSARRVRGGGRGPRLVAVAMLLGPLLLAPASASSDPRTEAQKVVAAADLTYRGGFAVTCSPSTWAKILDYPALIGRLWELGGYSPAHRVSLRGDVIHVDDPTGLTGDFVVFDKRADERRYWGRGRITHRAFPFLNTGQMVVVLRARPEGPRIVGSVDVFIRGDSAIARGALRTGRLLIQPRVDKRVRSHLIDVTHLIESLVNQPEAGLKLLQGSTADEFRAVFAPPKPAPPPGPSRARSR